MGKQKKHARTFMPEILFPNQGQGNSLSPATKKSVVPFNNVHTIQDVLDGKKYKLPGGGGDWSDGEDAQPKSYKEDGDQYKRRERDLEILQNLTQSPQAESQTWKVKVKGGYKEFPSLESAQRFMRKMRSKNVPVPWVSRVASKGATPTTVDDALGKTFMIESLDFIAKTKETGSAFCISEGYLVTCAHVVKSYNKNTESQLELSEFSDMIKVLVYANGQKVEAEVIDYDGVNDLALLKVDIESEVFSFDPYISIGEEVFAIGSPHGFENNASFGNVSSNENEIYIHEGAPSYTFVDLSIFPGNSGGPIVNKHTGKVIGMTTAIIGEGTDYGLNASLPSNYIISFCKKNGLQVSI